MTSFYMNTDLDIVSSDDLSPLLPILEEKCDLLHEQRKDDGLWYICVEAEGSGIIGKHNHQPGRDINALLDVIHGLDEDLKNKLLKAQTFDFNIGWQSSEHRPEGTLRIPNGLLRRISNTGATLTLTVYPSDQNDWNETRPKNKLP